jgi:hypothetical protein
MKIDELNKAKIPIVKIDKKLERFRGKVLFPEKLAKANEILSTVGMPNLETMLKESKKVNEEK